MAVTVEQAQALLNRLSGDERILLAQLFLFGLLVDDLPPVSVAPGWEAVAARLVAQGLADPARQQDVEGFARQAPEWGSVPAEWFSILPSGLAHEVVLTLLTGFPQDLSYVYGWWVQDIGRLRRFP